MCCSTPRAQLTLAMNPAAVAKARRFLADAFCPEHNAHVLDSALLLVSEAVTNAVRHGAPPITVAVECDGSRGLRVRVSDGDPRPPVKRTADLLDEGGRGLQLIDLLSQDWGIDPHLDGKEVWFVLRAADEPTAIG